LPGTDHPLADDSEGIPTGGPSAPDSGGLVEGHAGPSEDDLSDWASLYMPE
jgi:hypothetical protein